MIMKRVFMKASMALTGMLMLASSSVCAQELDRVAMGPHGRTAVETTTTFEFTCQGHEPGVLRYRHKQSEGVNILQFQVFGRDYSAQPDILSMLAKRRLQEHTIACFPDEVLFNVMTYAEGQGGDIAARIKRFGLHITSTGKVVIEEAQ